MSAQAQAASPAAYTSLDQIVAAVAAGKLNVDTASALLQRLQRSAPKALTVKVSAKGGMSVYGLQRMFGNIESGDDLLPSRVGKRGPHSDQAGEPAV